MCDFETSTEEWLVKDNGVARVWAGCLATIEKEPKVLAITNNIDDFMARLIKLGNIECYFHQTMNKHQYISHYFLHMSFP